jgi:small subunit ribosomal protein S3
MSHVVHPYAHRLVILRDWKSRWFGIGKGYAKTLKEDVLVREYLEKKLRGSMVSGIEIERKRNTFRVIIKTARAGIIIGRGGEGSVKLKEAIITFFRKRALTLPEDVKVDIEEVKQPESDASLVAQMVAEGLEKRLTFRRILKQTIEKVMANRNVKGAKIALSGRLGGADMSRRESIKRGTIPLQTFRADIDFAREKAHMPYGDIGIKVWIYKGEVFSAEKDAQVMAQEYK